MATSFENIELIKEIKRGARPGEEQLRELLSCIIRDADDPVKIMADLYKGTKDSGIKDYIVGFALGYLKAAIEEKRRR